MRSPSKTRKATVPDSAAGKIDPPCILIVDDDRLVLATLAYGLREAGYRVQQASNAEEALETIGAHAVDLAILDIRMPGMDGIELSSRLRDAQCAFIFLTAYGERNLVDEAARRGALGYLVKPLDMPQILPAVAAALARAHDIRELHGTASRATTALAIEQRTRTAVGVLMERHGIGRQAAFEQLRASARSQRRKIAEVADELLESTERGVDPVTGGAAE